MKKRELAERLLASFLDELDEQLRVLNTEVLALERQEVSGDGVRGLFRVAHTLKGAARAANVPLVEQVCHELEALLAAARGGAITLGAQEFALLFEAADALADASQRLRGGAGLEGSPLASLAARLVQAVPRTHPMGGRTDPAPARAPSPSPSPTPALSRVSVAPHAPGVQSAGANPHPPPVTPAAPMISGAETSVRVPAEKLDGLVAAVGALSQTRGQAADQAAEAAALESELARLTSRWRRRATQLRRGGGAAKPAEAADLLEETEHTLERLARQAAHLSAGAGRHQRSLTNADEDITARVRLLRMRPFADVAEALPRVVRDVAAAVGKDVRLELRGTEVEADRAVLDGLREPLVHLIRNAVDHGIEPAGTRLSRGKPAEGCVLVEAALRGDRLAITVADDGAGVDEAMLRRELGRAGRAPAPEPRALAVALLEGGVTTRTEASPISGRGVGLDIVRTAVQRLGGTLDVQWAAGGGTVFTLDCPVMLARMRAVLLSVGSQLLAIPAVHVERMQRTRRAELRRVGGRDVIVSTRAENVRGNGSGGDDPSGDAHRMAGDGAPIPLASLARVLGPPLVSRPAADPMPAFVVSCASGRVALVADELVGEQELVVRPLPRGYRVSPHLAGAAVLPSGAVALVLNATSLVIAALSGGAHVAPVADARDAVQQPRRILVADDSITTRTLEQSVLEAAGYHVETAHDGAEAWRLLGESEYDLVVSDVEMPRMDGFALCEAIRGSRRHASLPVVLVTAKEEPEHRARGLEAGADAYLGKAGFDQQDLLAVVRDLLA